MHGVSKGKFEDMSIRNMLMSVRRGNRLCGHRMKKEGCDRYVRGNDFNGGKEEQEEREIKERAKRKIDGRERQSWRKVSKNKDIKIVNNNGKREQDNKSIRETGRKEKALRYRKISRRT